MDVILTVHQRFLVSLVMSHVIGYLLKRKQMLGPVVWKGNTLPFSEILRPQQDVPMESLKSQWRPRSRFYGERLEVETHINAKERGRLAYNFGKPFRKC